SDMDVMVHSSLTSIGDVAGGAATMIDALLEAIGPGGTLLMPSFNHRAVQVFNPMTTPTTNGTIPDVMWRRSDAVRSLHP
ncbi:MAG: AAC(3) family N-acetyltransferase, partial [Candidatus Latescibacteria bacterium]|nr:AAC(3) family N-acetyltransferase [Candidatus Latescibacterota bacterium]